MDILSSLAVSDEYLDHVLSDEELLEREGIDSKKYKLSGVCKRGHDWKSTGKGLRYRVSGKCLECKGTSVKLKSDIDENEILDYFNIDRSRFRFGKICPNKHNWNETGFSLRASNNGRCVDCYSTKNLHPLPKFEKIDVIESNIVNLIEDSDIDPKLFYIGKMCRNYHNWNNTGYSLRRRTKQDEDLAKGECVKCRGIKNPGRNSYKLGREKYDILLREANISTELMHLGTLCRHNHDWNNTGYSLRYKLNNECVACGGVKRPSIKKLGGTEEDNFWLRVIKKGENDCWDWRAGRSSFGHGSFKLKNGKSIGAHRYSYILHYGDIEDDLHVRHKCDRPQCVNPNHLCLGTHQDNMNDRAERFRGVKGEEVFTAKLDEEFVRYAREEFYSGRKTIEELLLEKDVTKETMKNAIFRKSWKHVF